MLPLYDTASKVFNTFKISRLTINTVDIKSTIYYITYTYNYRYMDIQTLNYALQFNNNHKKNNNTKGLFFIIIYAFFT